jgi:hypothetical protein
VQLSELGIDVFLSLADKIHFTQKKFWRPARFGKIVASKARADYFASTGEALSFGGKALGIAW